MTVILLIVQRNDLEWNLTKTDLAVAAITVLWMISPLWSLCKTSAIRTAGLSLSLLGFYSLMQITFFNQENRQRLTNLTAIFFGIAELIAIVTFYYHYKEANRLGFTDLYSIRYLFHPFAETNNCWAQISLIGLCICTLSTRYKLITTCLCSIGALLTFSRGAYLAIALIIIDICFWSLKLRDLKKVIAGIAIGIVSVSTIFPGEISTVLSGTSTESQRKSLIWRKASSEKALDVFRSHMVLGTGGRSYSMVCDIHDSSDSAYSNYPPNLLSEILVEKGFVGIIVYGWLLSLTQVSDLV